MPEEIAEGKPVRRQTKTRQFYGFMGVTDYDEAFQAELEINFEENEEY